MDGGFVWGGAVGAEEEGAEGEFAADVAWELVAVDGCEEALAEGWGVPDFGDDVVGGFEVFFDEEWGDGEGVGVVVEAFAAGAVGWEFVAWALCDAEEVADGVAVFFAVEAS